MQHIWKRMLRWWLEGSYRKAVGLYYERRHVEAHPSVVSRSHPLFRRPLRYFEAMVARRARRLLAHGYELPEDCQRALALLKAHHLSRD